MGFPRRRPKAPTDRSPENDPIAGLAELGLLEAIPRISPGLVSPTWLGPREDIPGPDLISCLEGAPHGGLRVCSSPAVRHTKTTTLCHAMVHGLVKDPALEYCFLSNSLAFSQKWSRYTRRLVEACGVPLSRDFNTIAEWRTEAGGGVFWASLDQEVIGRGGDVFIADDPIGVRDSFDEGARDRAHEAIAFLTSRLNIGGSVIVNMSRLSTDDPIGRRPDWLQVVRPAILQENTPDEYALAPEIRPLEHLRSVRAELKADGQEWVWDSQYQGKPSLDQGGEFSGVTPFVGEIPKSYPTIFGCDFAYSPVKGDWIVLVRGRDVGGQYVVDHVDRHRRGTPGILTSYSAAKEAFPHARFASYVSGPELGVYQLLFILGAPVEMMPARFNKLVRARPYAHAWSKAEATDRVLVRADQSWSRAFIREHHAFTGREGNTDDQVDAGTAGYDAWKASRPIAGLGQRFAFGRAAM